LVLLEGPNPERFILNWRMKKIYLSEEKEEGHFALLIFIS
jgi:hypothetical protein